MKKNNESLPAIKPNALKIIQEILKDNNSKTMIADLGSGSQPDIISGLNNKHALSYFALDKDKKKLDLFKKNSLIDSSIKLRTVCGDVQKTLFKANSFDIVIFLETIEHLNNPEKALREIVRIAKPKSTIIISTPNIRRLDILLKRVLFFLINKNISYPKDYYYSPEHIREWEKEEFEKLLIKNGLTPKNWIIIPYPLELSGIKSIITLIVYPVLNFFIFVFQLKSMSSTLFAICKVKK